MTRAPMVRIWASLLLRARSAENVSWARAALTPGTLLALMAIPMPVPHMRMARSKRPAATCSATAKATSG